MVTGRAGPEGDSQCHISWAEEAADGLYCTFHPQGLRHGPAEALSLQKPLHVIAKVLAESPGTLGKRRVQRLVLPGLYLAWSLWRAEAWDEVACPRELGGPA